MNKTTPDLSEETGIMKHRVLFPQVPKLDVLDYRHENRVQFVPLAILASLLKTRSSNVVLCTY